MEKRRPAGRIGLHWGWLAIGLAGILLVSLPNRAEGLLSFDPEDVVLTSLLVEDSGAIVLGGYVVTSESPYLTDGLVAWLNPDGSLDSTRGPTVIPAASLGHSSASVGGIAFGPNGRLYVGVTGTTSSTNSDAFMIALTSTGDFDSTFSGDGIAPVAFWGLGETINDVVSTPDGGGVIAGSTHSSPFYIDSEIALAKFSSDGTLDSSFGSAGIITTPLNYSRLIDIGLDSLGRVVGVGETFNETTWVWDAVTVRYTTNGQLDAGFANGGVLAQSGYRHLALQVDPNDRPTLATSLGTTALAGRLTTSGAVDSAFGSGGYTDIDALVAGIDLVLQDDGDITFLGTDMDTMQLTASGVLNSGYGSGGFATGPALGDLNAFAAASDGSDGMYGLGALAFTGEDYLIHYGPAGELLEIIEIRLSPPDLFVYVALGDSYQSGEGAGWDVLDTNQYLTTVYENGLNYPEAVGAQENTYTPGVPIVPLAPGDGCHRALENYAKLNGDILEPGSQVVLVDRTCSGAEVDDSARPVVFNPNESLFTYSSDSQIQEALDRLAIAGVDPAEVDLVSVGMGGNDAGFGELVAACLLPSVFDELLNRHPDPPDEFKLIDRLFGDCRTFAGGFGSDSTNAAIDALVDLEVRGWGQILNAFPNARVLHLEYPSTLPERLPAGKWCGGILGADVGYANSRVDRINQRIRDAAANLGNPRIEIVPTGLAFRGLSGENNPLCPEDGSGQLANGIPRDNFDREIDRLLNVDGTGDAEARRLLDELIAEYREWKGCTPLGDRFLECNISDEWQDVQDAMSALLTHLDSVRDEILENLARDPASGESREIRFDRSRGLFHPNAEGFSVLACNVREFYAGRSVVDYSSDCFGGGSRPAAQIDGNDVGYSAIHVTPGQLLDLVFGGFGPNTIVDLFLRSEEQYLGVFTADGSGVISQSIQLPPASPGVHSLILEGTTATGVGVTKSALIEYPGLPSVGDSYQTYVCCFTTTGTDLDPADEVNVSLFGLELVTIPLDPLGGALVEVPVQPDVGDPRLGLVVVHTGTGETISPDIEVQPSVVSVVGTLELVISDLEAEIVSNPGASDPANAAIDNLQAALVFINVDEDRESAVEQIQGAAEVLDQSVADGIMSSGFVDVENDLLASGGRNLANIEILEAEEAGASQTDLDAARDDVDAGDLLRAAGEYPQALALYLQAIVGLTSGTQFSFADFVAFGLEGVYLKQGATVVSGHVGANTASAGPFLASGSEVTIGLSTTVPAGSVVAGDTVFLKQSASVYDVFYNELDGNGVPNGVETSPVSLPLVDDLPDLPVITPGTDDIDVALGATLSLGPGQYRTLKVKKGGTVRLTGGVYEFAEWDIGQDTLIYFEAPTEIRVAGRIQIDKNSTVGPAPEATTLEARDIVVWSAGINGNTGNVGATPRAVKIGLSSTVNAYVYAPNGTVWIRQNTVATGQFYGRWVIVGLNVTVDLE